MADVLQLDLVLFAQPPWITKRDQGQWDYQAPPQVPSVDPLQAAQSGDAVLLAENQAGLATEIERLQSQGYTVLEQLSLQFEQSRQNQAMTWQVRSGEALLVEPPRAATASNLMGSQWYEAAASRQVQSHYAIDGWVRAWVDRYLFVEFDIAQFVGNTQRLEEVRSRSSSWQPSAGFGRAAGQSYNPFPNTTSGEPAGALSTLDAWPAEAVDLYRLHERKRVRLNELHYFDHPRIGMLIQVSEPERSSLTEPGS